MKLPRHVTRYIGQTGRCINVKRTERTQKIKIKTKTLTSLLKCTHCFALWISFRSYNWRRMNKKKVYWRPFAYETAGNCISKSSITLDRQEKQYSGVSQLILPFYAISFVVPAFAWARVAFIHLFLGTTWCTCLSLENTRATGKCFYETKVC